MRIKDKNHIVINGWMYRLGLSSITEVIAFAAIYGFSQDNSSEFKGSITFIQDFLMCSRPTAIKVMKNLENKGLITKRQTNDNGIVLNRYSVNLEVVNSLDYPQLNDLTTPSKTDLPHIYKDNNEGNNSSNSPDINISPIPTEPPLLFPTETIKTPKGEKSKIIDLSFVRADLLPLMIEWMDYRKEIKKPIKTQSGINLNYKDLLNYSGGDVNLARKVVETSISRGWTGLQPLKQDNYGNPTSRPTDSQLLGAAIRNSWGPGGNPFD